MVIQLQTTTAIHSEADQSKIHVPRDYPLDNGGVFASGTITQTVVPDSGLAISVGNKVIPPHCPIDILIAGQDMYINGTSVRGNPDLSIPLEHSPSPLADSVTISVRRLIIDDNSPLQRDFDYIIHSIQHAADKGGTLLVGFTRQGQVYCGLIPRESDPSYAESRVIIPRIIKLIDKLGSTPPQTTEGN